MVHLRCQYIQSRINHQTLQQWRTLLRNTQCQQWRLSNLSKQRLFSTHSKKNSSVYCFTKEELEDATNMLNSHMLKQDKQKRQLNKRISSQITAQINQHISSPNVLSLHTHLQKGNYTEVWILLDKIIHEKQSIPIAIAQQLLQVLRNEICQQQTKLKRHKGQLQNIYITRLEHILNHLSNQSKWEQQDIGIIIDLFGRLDRVDRAEVIYRNINQYSYQPLTTETCNKMLSMYFKRFKFCDATIQTKYMSKMISIISNMPHRGCQPDITTYNWIIAAKMKLNDMKGAEKYFRDMTIKPDRTTYHLLLQGAFKHGSVSTHGYSADYWMECMVKDGLAPNKKSFKHIFNGLSDQLNHFSRMKDWDNMHRISKLVKQLFDIMPKLHYKPDIDHVNTLLKCFVISNNDTEIKNIIKSLDIPQVKKTNGCGGGCGGCGCQPKQQQKEQQQQIEKAITDHKLKNRKKNKKAFVLKYKPNIITFNMLIHYELKNLRLNNALKWYDDMMHMEIEPDTVTYGSFIGYYIKQNNIDEAIKYYDVMQHKGIPGNNHIYNMLLQGSSKQPSVQNKIMDRHRVLIVEDNVNQDIVSYNSQLSSLLSHCHHDISSVSRQIDYATAEWISNQFVNIYEQMLSHEVVPNERTYNIALDIYGKLSKHHILDTTISSIMESMSTTGLKPDLITYAINIRNAIYQQNPSLAESIFRSMLDDNIKPNNYIFSHLIIGYVKEGDLKKANQILNDMSEKPFYVKPTIYEYTPLIHGYAALGHLDQVYTLFRNMIDQDLKPDMTIYSILANTLIDNGSPKEAVQLLTGLLQQNTDNNNNNNNNNSNNNNGNNQSSISEKAEKYPYLPFDDIAIGLLIKAHGVVGSQNANNNNNNSNNNNNNNNNNNIINTTTTTTTTYNNNNNNNSIQNNDINNILLSSLPSSTSSIASISHVKAIQHIYSTIHQPNDIVNSIYLHALSRLKQPQCVWDAWQSMKHHSVIHYNILFSGLGENEQWYPKLKQVFDTMSCTPDGVTFDTMIMNAMKNNDIEYICHHLWPSDRRPRPYLHDDKDGYNLRQQQSSLMLIKTYFLTMKAMLSCQDYQKAKQVFLEFTSLPDHPASATLWKKEILALAHLNGFINH
ncbi:hypothetical protein BJ944DRAFT_228521 [Cunninghamella echinulata]|nr:hypothetical protein BJ944DRAFT_228521 [Cunninghamella echinulata]